MRKIIFAFFIAGALISSCDSKRIVKRSTSKKAVKPANHTRNQATIPANSVSYDKQGFCPSEEQSANSRLDSLIENSGAGRRYSREKTNFRGASGPGTGASYASGHYARQRPFGKDRDEPKENNYTPDWEVRSFEQENSGQQDTTFVQQDGYLLPDEWEDYGNNPETESDQVETGSGK